VALHITNGNCSPPCSGGSGSAKHRSGYALCGFAPPHFAVAGLCFAKPLFATAKRQLPRTLDAILLGVTGGIGNGFVVALR